MATPSRNIVLGQELIDEVTKIAEEEGITFTAAARRMMRIGLLVFRNPKLTGKKASEMDSMRTDIAERAAKNRRRHTAEDFFA